MLLKFILFTLSQIVIQCKILEYQSKKTLPSYHPKLSLTKNVERNTMDKFSTGVHTSFFVGPPKDSIFLTTIYVTDISLDSTSCVPSLSSI